MKHALTRIVSWGHDLLAEVVSPDDLTVDLTAGNGHDALMLYRLVGNGGRVVVFDIQSQALQATEQRLQDAGAEVLWIDGQNSVSEAAGVSLIASSHAELDHYLSAAPKAVVANLGYLPGGDQQLITRPEATLAALKKSADLLAPGGRLAVVIYPGHVGGQEEAQRVDQFFQDLPEQDFEVLCLRVSNSSQSPYLQVAEKKSRTKQTN